MSLQAANPGINATVTASAGSGKTYMLVTRILRLLLEDAEPGSILALTFTRKAAAEMQQRLAERLYQLATVDNEQLLTLLKELDLDSRYQQKARGLYEAHQYCDYPVRTLTFHSFCQDLLARFPLEADVPPNFDLLENAELLIQQAREALFNEATLHMQGALAEHLQSLMQFSGGLFNLTKILNNFLHHRSDWWAYTDNIADKQITKAEFASQQLAQQLEVNTEALDTDSLYGDFFTEKIREEISSYAKLLALNPTRTNLQKADTLASCLAKEQFNPHAFTEIQACFIKKDGGVFVLKDTPTLRRKLGDNSAEILLELHQHIAACILDTLDHLKKINTFRLNHHWYFCGEKFIEHYQTLKFQQRLLDFTDLEWRSFKLLQDSENALWIQYKLDRQIQHLLIDEFQDTNPTQWQLILPLLEEMAAAVSEKNRSVFLVGDEKQSIYSFRRAKPELQQQASDWLAQHLNAQAFPLNKSWRSSPAIIDTVNAVFLQPGSQQTLAGFIEHQTHHQQLAGKVEVLPLWHMHELAESDTGGYCRNPLKQPRAESTGIHQQEARQIARHIQQLLKNKTPVSDNKKLRPVSYDDIFILVRKRAHVADYERALREAGIPYLGTNRGTFLSCLEIQDMQALLDTLLTPFNNLALAQVLKSPLFCASDNDLQLIAAHNNHSHWFDRLELMAEELEQQHPLHRAWYYLTRWRALADKIPVHDLLDKIFCEADVLERYKRSTAESLQPRVQANLSLFLEMALDLDSGRYPSLMHFLFYLRSLKNTPGDAPDEAPMETREARVRIMTIHASKGLEAAVVYLADTISGARDKSSLSTLVDWPVDAKQPIHFQLIPAAKQQDSMSANLNQQHKTAQLKEEANLLYVAITRARQYLFISGCQPDKGPFTNWYQPLFNALQTLTDNSEDNHLIYSVGEQTACAEVNNTQAPDTTNVFDIDPALTQKISTDINPPSILAPSYSHDRAEKHPTSDMSISSEDAQHRGIAIHRMLELLSHGVAEERILQQICFEMALENNSQLQRWLNIALNNFQHPDLQTIFKPDNNLQVFNECPIQYMQNNRLVYGIIDRLIIGKNNVMVIDYKTHRHADRNNLTEIADDYRQQMHLYAEGIKALWPDKQIKKYLLFTECLSLFPLDA